MDKIDNGTEETIDKIDNGVEETLKDIVKDDWIQPFSENIIKTLRTIILDIYHNPTFKRFIEPPINSIKSYAKTTVFPAGITPDMCARVIYNEGVMKFSLCTPEECKNVIFNAVSKAKNYTDANEEANDQESFYKLVRGLALKQLESKILLKTADPVFVKMLQKHKRYSIPLKMLIDVEEALVNLYNEINLNNY